MSSASRTQGRCTGTIAAERLTLTRSLRNAKSRAELGGAGQDRSSAEGCKTAASRAVFPNGGWRQPCGAPQSVSPPGRSRQRHGGQLATADRVPVSSGASGAAGGGDTTRCARLRWSQGAAPGRLRRCNRRHHERLGVARQDRQRVRRRACRHSCRSHARALHRDDRG